MHLCTKGNFIRSEKNAGKISGKNVMEIKQFARAILLNWNVFADISTRKNLIHVNWNTCKSMSIYENFNDYRLFLRHNPPFEKYHD